MSGDLILGIDGGGTSTVAWLADASGNVLGRGLAGPSNAKAVGMPSALVALELATASAFADAAETPRPVEVACLGLAGFSRPEDRIVLQGWADAYRLARRLLPVSDGDLVVAAGTPEGWGVGVIAGTGSIAVSRDQAGRTARAGGWGPLIGDEGSAYNVVLDALRRVARRADGREPAPSERDPLTTRLLAALGVGESGALVSVLHAPGMDRARIAALAPEVLAAAREDTSLVDDLLVPAGRALALAALAVARALGWQGGALPLALAGGFLLASDDVARGLRDGLERAGYRPAATLVPDPVQGALILAREYPWTGATAVM